MRRLLRFSRNRTSPLGESGFTLLETIIAMAIMVVALTSILSIESSSLNASARAKQMNVVAMLAKGKMVEVEYDIEGKTFEEVKKENAGAFPAPYADYRWTWVVKELEFPNLSLAPPSGEGDSGGATGGATEITETLTKLVTKFFSKALREVTVTVFWRRGDGEQSFSVSTYWVNLNHEFQLSE